MAVAEKLCRDLRSPLGARGSVPGSVVLAACGQLSFEKRPLGLANL